MNMIERQVNFVESKKLKCNLRIFGIAERESKSVSLESLVSKEVLTVAECDESKILLVLVVWVDKRMIRISQEW